MCDIEYTSFPVISKSSNKKCKEGENNCFALCIFTKKKIDALVCPHKKLKSYLQTHDRENEKWVWNIWPFYVVTLENLILFFYHEAN